MVSVLQEHSIALKGSASVLAKCVARFAAPLEAYAPKGMIVAWKTARARNAVPTDAVGSVASAPTEMFATDWRRVRKAFAFRESPLDVKTITSVLMTAATRKRGARTLIIPRRVMMATLARMGMHAPTAHVSRGLT